MLHIQMTYDIYSLLLTDVAEFSVVVLFPVLFPVLLEVELLELFVPPVLVLLFVVEFVVLVVFVLEDDVLLLLDELEVSFCVTEFVRLLLVLVVVLFPPRCISYSISTIICCSFICSICGI